MEWVKNPKTKKKTPQSNGSSHNVTCPDKIPHRFHDLGQRISLFFFHMGIILDPWCKIESISCPVLWTASSESVNC